MYEFLRRPYFDSPALRQQVFHADSIGALNSIISPLREEFLCHLVKKLDERGIGFSDEARSSYDDDHSNARNRFEDGSSFEYDQSRLARVQRNNSVVMPSVQPARPGRPMARIEDVNMRSPPNSAASPNFLRNLSPVESSSDEDYSPPLNRSLIEPRRLSFEASPEPQLPQSQRRFSPGVPFAIEYTQFPPVNCDDLVVSRDLYLEHFHSRPGKVLSLNADANVEIEDSLYVEAPKGLNFLVQNRNHVILLTSDSTSHVKGSFFEIEPFVSWIREPNNIVAACDGRRFNRFSAEVAEIYYVRLNVSGVNFYVPYHDVLSLCGLDRGVTFFLEETSMVLTNVVSLSVMMGADYISSQHCSDPIPKPIYRLRSVIVRVNN